MMQKTKHAASNTWYRIMAILRGNSGDQLTGWLIVSLVVVVAGALFLTLYQSSISDIWSGIIAKMKSSFGI